MSETKAGTDKLDIDNMFLCASSFSRVKLDDSTFTGSHLMRATFEDVNASEFAYDKLNSNA